MKKVDFSNPFLWFALARESGYNARKLAKSCGRSMRQVDRYCHKIFEKSTKDWLSERRSLDAAELLMNCSSVKEAAFQLGYKQVSHFCRHFKNYYGVTPNEFIQLSFSNPLLSIGRRTIGRRPARRGPPR